MRIGWSVPLPGPFRVSGSVRRSRRRRGRSGGTSGCLPWVALALVIGAPVAAVQSCQAKAALGYTDPGQLASAIKGYAQQKTGTAPAAVSCDQNGDTLAYTCYASFAAAPTITYDVVITPDGKSYLVTGHTTAEATPYPSVGDEAPVTTSGNSGSGGGIYIPHPHIYVCAGRHIRVCS
jgi:hypothetical protein